MDNREQEESVADQQSEPGVPTENDLLRLGEDRLEPDDHGDYQQQHDPGPREETPPSIPVEVSVGLKTNCLIDTTLMQLRVLNISTIFCGAS
jgi:hypothetical protein